MVKAGTATISADGDPVRHLTVGQAILTSGTFPTEDAFVYTKAANPTPPHEWLAKLAIATTYQRTGLAGPVLLSAALVGLAFAILFRHLRSRGHPALLALGVTLLAAAVASTHWLPRPHVFSFAAAAAFGAVLDGWYAGRLSRRWLWVLPLGMVLWVNAHGGFLVGLILVATYAGADTVRALAGDDATAAAARRRLRTLLPAAGATLAAVLLNPAGPGVFADLHAYGASRLVLDYTQEYRSPDFHTGATRFFLAMLLVSVAALAASRRRPALHEGLLLLGFTGMALFSARHAALYAIVTAPLLAAQLAALPAALPATGWLGRILAHAGPWLARRDAIYAALDARARGHVWPVLAVAGLACLAAGQWQAGQAPLGIRLDPALQPVAAVAYLQAHPPDGPGFNEHVWGGYLLYRLWPTQRVFIDGELTARHESLIARLPDGSELGRGLAGGARPLRRAVGALLDQLAPRARPHRHPRLAGRLPGRGRHRPHSRHMMAATASHDRDVRDRAGPPGTGASSPWTRRRPSWSTRRTLAWSPTSPPSAGPPTSPSGGHPAPLRRRHPGGGAGPAARRRRAPPPAGARQVVGGRAGALTGSRRGTGGGRRPAPRAWASSGRPGGRPASTSRPRRGNWICWAGPAQVPAQPGAEQESARRGGGAQ